MAGALVSSVGTGVSLVAVTVFLAPWGPAWVSAALVAEFAPAALGGAVAGRLVDAVDSRSLLVSALLVQAVAAAAVALLGVTTGSPWAVVLVMACLGAGATVTGPTIAALLPRIGGEDAATSRFGMYAMSSQAGFFLGMTSGGILVAYAGTQAALLVDSSSYVVMALAVGTLRVRRHRRAEEGGTSPPDRRAGFAVIRGDRSLLLTTYGFGVALGVAVVVNVAEVFFVLDDLRGGPALFGIVVAAWPIAGVLGGAVAGRLDGGSRTIAAVWVGIAVMGVAFIAAAATRSPPVVIAAWASGGFANALAKVSVMATLRARSADGERGRVFAAALGVFAMANVVGMVGGGLLVSVATATGVILAAGVVVLAAGLLLGSLVPSTTPARRR